MALTRLGTNSITALPSGIGGKVKQIVGSENTATNSIAGAEGTEYIIQDSSGDWETSITINQGNKIYMSFFMNFAKDTDDANYFILGKYNVDGGSFTNMANPVSLDSRRQAMIAGNRPYSTASYFTTPVSGSFVFTPTISGSTGIIKVKFAVVQTAGGSRDIYFNYSTNTTDESFTSVAHCALMEIE